MAKTIKHPAVAVFVCTSRADICAGLRGPLCHMAVAVFARTPCAEAKTPQEIN